MGYSCLILRLFHYYNVLVREDSHKWHTKVVIPVVDLLLCMQKKSQTLWVNVEMIMRLSNSPGYNSNFVIHKTIVIIIMYKNSDKPAFYYYTRSHWISVNILCYIYNFCLFCFLLNASIWGGHNTTALTWRLVDISMSYMYMVGPDSPFAPLKNKRLSKSLAKCCKFW